MDSGDSLSRLFYAIPSCKEILEAYEILRTQNIALPGIRWIPPANHHITLYFLGEVKTSYIPDLIAIMDGITNNTPDFEMVCNTISLEGGRAGHPSMVWAKFEKHVEFTKLSNRIKDTTGPMVTVPSRFADPVPHITLARIRHGPPPQIENLVSCTIRFHGLELWKTVRSSTGVCYEVLSSKYRE